MRKHFDKRYHKYHAWKTAFRACLNTQDFPCDLGPGRYWLEVEIDTEKPARYDLDNACKAIQDASWDNDHGIRKLSAVIYDGHGVDQVRLRLRRIK